MNRNTKRALPAAALASLLFAGPAIVSAVASERQQQPPVVQPSPPAAQLPPATEPVPQVQPPAQPPQPTPAPTTQPPATQSPETTATAQAPNHSTPSGGAGVLLDRISDLVDQALGHKPAPKRSDKGTPGATGTSGVKVGKTNAGTVVVDRAALDEIKAEVEQLRVMLKDKQL